jgi:hypothetical protein
LDAERMSNHLDRHRDRNMAVAWGASAQMTYTLSLQVKRANTVNDDVVPD